LLPIDRWTSAVNSGYLRFFKVDEEGRLSRLYDDIRKYNYEANLTRDNEVYVSRYPHDETLFYAFSCSVDRLVTEGEKLLKQLQELKGKTWLKPAKHWWQLQFWK